MKQELTALIDASAAYTSQALALADLRNQKALLLAQADDINAKIAALVLNVAQAKQDLKTAAAAL